MYRDDHGLSHYAHAPNSHNNDSPDPGPEMIDNVLDEPDRDDTAILGGAGPILAVLTMALLGLLALQFGGAK